MGHSVNINMSMSVLTKLKKMARAYSGDNSLGINQSCHVLLEAIASGEFARAEKKKVKAEVQEGDEE